MDNKIALHCLKTMICQEMCEECPVYGEVGTDHCSDEACIAAIKALETVEKIKEIICEQEHYQVSTNRPNQADYDAVSADKFQRIWQIVSEAEKQSN